MIRTIRERFPSHAVLAMGANADAAAVSRALFVGADGYVDKSVTPDRVPRRDPTFDAGRDGPRGTGGRPIWGTSPSPSTGGVTSTRRLTTRELQVLTVAAEGLTAKQIADRLGVRERTVTTHLGRIYVKLGVGSRLAAIRTATRSGLVGVAVAE